MIHINMLFGYLHKRRLFFQAFIGSCLVCHWDRLAVSVPTDSVRTGRTGQGVSGQ